MVEFSPALKELIREIAREEIQLREKETRKSFDDIVAQLKRGGKLARGIE